MNETNLIDTPIFFHVHVRKCGGSTFHATILKRNFGDGYYRDSSLIDDRYSKQQVTEVLSNCPWLRAYSSHKISLDLPYDFPSRHVIAVAFVRDPVERFVSMYNYLHHHAHDWDRDAKQLGLSQYTQQAVEKGVLQTQRQHSQVEQLSNLRGSAGMSAIENYCTRDDTWLFPMDRFDDACLLLERVYPDHFRDGSYFDRLNRSSRDSSPSAADRESLFEVIDPAEFQVVDLARRRLEERLNTFFPEPQSLATARQDFSRRCRAHKSRLRRFFR